MLALSGTLFAIPISLQKGQIYNRTFFFLKETPLTANVKCGLNEHFSLYLFSWTFSKKTTGTQAHCLHYKIKSIINIHMSQRDLFFCFSSLFLGWNRALLCMLSIIPCSMHMVRGSVESHITRGVRFVFVSSGRHSCWGEILNTHLKTLVSTNYLYLDACPCQFIATSSEWPWQSSEVTVLTVQG